MNGNTQKLDERSRALSNTQTQRMGGETPLIFTNKLVFQGLAMLAQGYILTTQRLIRNMKSDLQQEKQLGYYSITHNQESIQGKHQTCKKEASDSHLHCKVSKY